MPGLEPKPCPQSAAMEFPPSTHLGSAIATQTLALPCTLLLCITSMLRERSLGHQDETRLVRLYKQHAFILEVVQSFVALMACGFMTGNTVAAWETRALVIDFASEDVTSAIIRYAIARNAWLSASALCVLTCMSMLDSWSLPHSLRDLTDPLFPLTRELIRSFIWRHEDKNYDNTDCKNLSYDVERPRLVLSTVASVYIERSPNRNLSESPERTTQEATTTAEKTEEGPEPPKEKELSTAEILPDTPPPSLPSSPLKPRRNSNDNSSRRTPSPNPNQTQSLKSHSHLPASRPRYQAQTLISALRASSNANASRSRSRKRSVTFDLQAKPGDGARSAQGSRERSRVREREREFEKSERDGKEEAGALGEKEGRLGWEQEQEQKVKQVKCEDADGVKEQGKEGEGNMFADAVEVGSEVC